LHQEIIMPWVPGANDNASGIAVLLNLAEELEGLQHTTLWLVATGSKEAGLHGARAFLRHYPFPRESTYIINLDTVGRGQLGIIVWEGKLFARQADPQLVKLAGDSESDDITIDADPLVYRTTNTDAQVPLVRGFRAMSIVSLEAGRPAFRHWPTDTLENIHPELLERAARLVIGIARRLDRQVEE
jgi:Zn-dependent M28 family amino/carboxypeptidase